MPADPLALAKLLSLGALIAATIEYAEILKRRTRSRVVAAMQQESAETGLLGLVRVFLADDQVGRRA